jgi:hypothetical protein
MAEVAFKLIHKIDENESSTLPGLASLIANKELITKGFFNKENYIHPPVIETITSILEIIRDRVSSFSTIEQCLNTRAILEIDFFPVLIISIVKDDRKLIQIFNSLTGTIHTYAY